MRGIAATPVVDSDETSDPGPSFDRDYWLDHCEGFRVESRGKRLGLVEEVIQPHGDRPGLLAVRGDVLGRRVLHVPMSDVAFVVPRDLRVFLNTSGR